MAAAKSAPGLHCGLAGGVGGRELRMASFGGIVVVVVGALKFFDAMGWA